MITQWSGTLTSVGERSLSMSLYSVFFLRGKTLIRVKDIGLFELQKVLLIPPIEEYDRGPLEG
jgi:hypothetical protein